MSLTDEIPTHMQYVLQPTGRVKNTRKILKDLLAMHQR